MKLAGRPSNRWRAPSRFVGPSSPRRRRRLLGRAVVAVLAAALVGPPAARATFPGLVGAVRLTLERDPNLALAATRVEVARGFLLTARGRFDPFLSAALIGSDLELPESAETTVESRLLEGSLLVAKEFASGLSIEPRLDLTRIETPGEVTVNTSIVSFTVRQPLLRDHGRDVVTAGTLAAERELTASRFDRRHTVAQRVVAVATQYWLLRAAEEGLAILRGSEQRSRELLETTRRLIEADVTPAAELVQLEADLTSKESQRIGGERDLFAARLDLGREIGLPAADPAVSGLPSDPFPALAAGEVAGDAGAAAYVELALELRADLEAARQRLAAAELRLRAARDAVEPRLDLLFVPSYSGLVEGDGDGELLAPLADGVPGLGASLGLSFEWPIVNRARLGDLLRAQAAGEQSALELRLLHQQIGADVPIALDAVRRTAEQLERAVRAVELFEVAVANEEKKLRAGTSTLIDVISQQDRLTASRQNAVGARFNLALALLELRFQTGTLLVPLDGEELAVTAQSLTAVPAVGGSS